MNLLFTIFVLFFASFAESLFFTQSKLEQSGEGNKDLNSECLNMDETYNEDKKKYCRAIFNNDYIKWSEKMLSDEEFVKDLEVIHNDNDEKSQRKRRSLRKPKCPVFSKQYLRENPQMKQRSVSPWRYIINVDNSRIPRRILDTRCLCKGCINIKTGNEDSSNYRSVPVPITIPVRSNNAKSSIDINLGCTCNVILTTEDKKIF